ncbi:MAG TPA: CDP-glucose 4,6-dehydratase [Pirellulales bacterium]
MHTRHDHFPAAFAGRSVLLTGHTGFKGSWLALWLARLGARVAGYALAPHTQPNNFTASRVREVLSAHYEADIRDRASLEQALRDCQPEVIFHLAAQPLVRASYAEPLRTIEVNVLGTANLLEAVRAVGLRCVVIVVTSDKCYENCEQAWGYREHDPLGGSDPYSASKAAAELIAASYRSSFFPPEQLSRHGVSLATVRSGNAIGGGDWAADRIVTDIVGSLGRGEPIRLRNPHAVRPWQHVLEPLSGYLRLAADLLADGGMPLCGSWNFGPMPGDEVTVGELAARFASAWGQGSCIQVSATGNDPPEADVLRLCIDKAIWDLGWQPQWNVHEAVERTVRWFQDYRSADNMQPECLRDIADYETCLANQPHPGSHSCASC